MKLSPGLIIGLAAVILVVGLGAFVGIAYLTYSNAEIRLRNQITAVQKDNENLYDNTWKKIAQAAQIPAAKKDAFKEIFVQYAQARSGEGGKAFVNAVHEAIPTVDLSVFDNLMNMIGGARDTWASNQTRLIGLKQAHDNCLTTAPSSWFVGGRPPIEVKIVTSSRTEQAFSAGKDDDISVFPAAAPAVPKK